MKHYLHLCIMTALALSLFACGGSEDADQAGPAGDSSGAAAEGSAPQTPSNDITGKMLDELDALTTVLKDVKDEASAKAAAQYITDYAERHEALAEQFKALSPAEQVASSQKQAGRNMEVQMALQKEMMRIGMDPELSKHLSEAFKQINRQ